LVDNFLAGSCHDAAEANTLRAQLTLWTQNDAKLTPPTQRSFLAKEVAATSRDLSAIGTAGLLALDAVSSGAMLPPDVQIQLAAALTEAAKPKAQLLLIPVSAVKKLVDAASQPGTCSSAKP
jgi:hypothetical protein